MWEKFTPTAASEWKGKDRDRVVIVKDKDGKVLFSLIRLRGIVWSAFPNE